MIKKNITNVSQLILIKITGVQTWCQINYYVSNNIGKIKITKNTHGKIILERQTTTESEKVRRVWKQVFKTFAYYQLDHVTVTNIKMERLTFQLTNSRRAAFDIPTQAAVGRKVYSTRSLVIE